MPTRIRSIDDPHDSYIALHIPYSRRPQLIAALHEARDNTQSRSTHDLFTILICFLDPNSHLRAPTEGSAE